LSIFRLERRSRRRWWRSGSILALRDAKLAAPTTSRISTRDFRVIYQTVDDQLIVSGAVGDRRNV
jgi:hypothetical protein